MCIVDNADWLHGVEVPAVQCSNQAAISSQAAKERSAKGGPSSCRQWHTPDSQRPVIAAGGEVAVGQQAQASHPPFVLLQVASEWQQQGRQGF
jgi:hypothetical protein